MSTQESVTLWENRFTDKKLSGLKVNNWCAMLNCLTMGAEIIYLALEPLIFAKDQQLCIFSTATVRKRSFLRVSVFIFCNKKCHSLTRNGLDRTFDFKVSFT